MSVSLEPVAAGVWRLPLAGGTVNVYLLVEDDGLTLVDSGYPGCCEAILAGLGRSGYAVRDVRRLVLTHADIDHMGSLDDLRRRTGAQVLAHSLEEDIISGQKQRPWGATREARLLAFAYHLLQRSSHTRLQPSAVDRRLDDGQSWGGRWQVVHTPGHTPGHIALFAPDRRVLLTGDALGRRGRMLKGPRPMYAADIGEAIASVRKLAALQPETLLFGHREPLTHVREQVLAELADQLAQG
jgi:glyoxylase-like metal-dependent hydrolase (beta-lactamase superfamily II)